MQCVVFCLVGFTLLIAMLWTMMNKHVTRDFEKSLDKRQKKKYHKLAGQRLKNAAVGFAVGMAAAVAYYYFYARHTEASNNTVTACAMTAITLVTMICWYMYMAPSESMLAHIDPDQTYLWMEVHSKMMRNFFVGMLIGAIGFFLLSLGGQDLCAVSN